MMTNARNRASAEPCRSQPTLPPEGQLHAALQAQYSMSRATYVLMFSMSRATYVLMSYMFERPLHTRATTSTYLAYLECYTYRDIRSRPSVGVHVR